MPWDWGGSCLFLLISTRPVYFLFLAGCLRAWPHLLYSLYFSHYQYTLLNFSQKKKRAYACHTPMPQFGPCINKTLKPHPLITALDFVQCLKCFELVKIINNTCPLFGHFSSFWRSSTLKTLPKLCHLLQIKLNIVRKLRI